MHYPAPSRPAAFRRPRLLIVGCGDVGLRLARLSGRHFRMRALTSSPERCQALREAGITPLLGNLDAVASLGRLAGLASRVVHLAPPAAEAEHDTRTAALLSALARRSQALRLVYVSTTGVYGDAGGAWIDETRVPQPHTARAKRRWDAEQRCRFYARAMGWTSCVLRAPGIYAWNRPGGDPRERLRQGVPVLLAEHDGYTNHVHADDLARACHAALFRGRPLRSYNVCDDQALKTGDYYEQVAALTGEPPPQRIGPEEAARWLSPTRRSFLAESRRLRNDRLKRELRLRLTAPDVATAWHLYQLAR